MKFKNSDLLQSYTCKSSWTIFLHSEFTSGDHSLLGLKFTSMITSGGCSPLLLGVVLHYYYTTTTILLLLSVCQARCLDFYDNFLTLFSTTSTFCVLVVMIPPSSEWCVLLWSPLVIILHCYYFLCVKHNVSSTTCPSCVLGVRIPPSSEWRVLLWSPLMIILHYYYFPRVNHDISNLQLFSPSGVMYAFFDPHPVAIAFLALPDGQWLIIGSVKDHILWPLLSCLCHGISL